MKRIKFLTFIFLAFSFLGVPEKSISASISFQPIYFDTGKIELDAAAKAALLRVVELLKGNPKAFLTLEGHSTAENPDAALRLSQARVDLAFGELMRLAKDKNIAMERLEATAFGDTRLAEKANPQDRANNRVEFLFKDDEELANASKKGLETIKVVYWNTLYHCLFQIGVNNKTFEDEGFHVQLIATNHSTVNQINAICGKVPFEQYSESVFAGGVCGGSPHLAAAQGVEMVVIGGMLYGGSMMIAKPQMAAKLKADPKNFRGIRFGQPVGTNITGMVVTGWLFRNGIDWKKEITWVNYPSHEAVLEAIAKGEVDAGDTYAPLQVRAAKDYGIQTVYNTVELFPFHPCCRIVTTPAKLKKDRPKYVRFMRGVINSHRFFIKNRKKALETVQRATGYTPEEVATLNTPAFTLHPDPLRNGLIKFWTLLNQSGFLNSKADIRNFVDNSVYLEALKSLMKEHPADEYYQYMMQQYNQFNL